MAFFPLVKSFSLFVASLPCRFLSVVHRIKGSWMMAANVSTTF